MSDYKVQSILFDKSKWNEESATKWLKTNKHKIKGVDVKPKMLRFRQYNPAYIKKQGYTHFVTKKLPDGIDLVIAYKEKMGAGRGDIPPPLPPNNRRKQAEATGMGQERLQILFDRINLIYQELFEEYNAIQIDIINYTPPPNVFSRIQSISNQLSLLLDYRNLYPTLPRLFDMIESLNEDVTALIFAMEMVANEEESGAGRGKCEGGSLNPDVMKNLLKQSYEKGLKDYEDFKIDKSLSGARTQVYFNSLSGQAVVVHRGSQGIKDWVVNDAGLLVGYRGERFTHAKEIQKKAEKKYGKENVTTLGHSLGSKIAEEVGGDSKEVITLNKPTTPIDLVTGKKVPANQFDIRTTNDVVSILRPYQRESNNEITIPSSSYNILKEHSPDVLSKLDKKKEIGIGGGAGASIPFSKEVQKKINKKKEKTRMEYRRELNFNIPDTIKEHGEFVPLEVEENKPVNFGGGAGASTPVTTTRLERRLARLEDEADLLAEYLSQPNLNMEDPLNQRLVMAFQEVDRQIAEIEAYLDDVYSSMGYELGEETKEGGRLVPSNEGNQDPAIVSPQTLIREGNVTEERLNERADQLERLYSRYRRTTHEGLINGIINQLERLSNTARQYGFNTTHINDIFEEVYNDFLAREEEGVEGGAVGEYGLKKRKRNIDPTTTTIEEEQARVQMRRERQRQHEMMRQEINNRITNLEQQYYDINSWGTDEDNDSESFFTQVLLDELNTRARRSANQYGFTDLVTRINTIIQEITDDWNSHLIANGDQPVVEGGKRQTEQEIVESISNEVSGLINEYNEIEWTTSLNDTNESQYKQTERILDDLKELKNEARQYHLNQLSNIIQQMIESIITDGEEELMSGSEESSQTGGMRDGLTNASYAGSPEFRDFCCLY